ncbi:hypothetical protein [Rhodococcus sp. WY5]|jgi:hypothetical protein|uniref:hypothetical protein n=1 Tax=Rhodococcus sp. WY5 TaxID=2708349 RepID=UPI001BDE7E02|nr:hypothetical protein [Rhodococcus sp. WY5]
MSALALNVSAMPSTDFDAADLPSGTPASRFFRYVRGSAAEDGHLFPRDGASIPLRLLIDASTLPLDLLNDTDFVDVINRPEVEPYLCWLKADRDTESVRLWRDAIREFASTEIGFVDLESCSRMGDSVSFRAKTTFIQGSTMSIRSANFFPVYQQLDEHAHPDVEITMADRIRTAVFAASATSMEAHALVTGMKTVGRVGVGENDLLALCSADDAIGLIGHYLRMTGSRHFKIADGGRRSYTLKTLKGFYSTCVEVNSPMAHLLNFAAAHVLQDQAVVDGTFTIIARLERAARAVDELLRFMTRLSPGRLDDDTAEEIAEAFDRELLYISAVLDSCGRMFAARIGTEVASKGRYSLQSQTTFTKIIDPHYGDSPLLARLHELQPMMHFAHELRNKIHDTTLQSVHSYSRSYGGSRSATITLDLLPHTVSDTRELGIYVPQSDFPSAKDQAVVADLPTLATVLLRRAMEFVNTFLFMIASEKPSAAPNAAKVLGAMATGSDQALTVGETPALIGRLFGWDVPQPFKTSVASLHTSPARQV